MAVRIGKSSSADKEEVPDGSASLKFLRVQSGMTLEQLAADSGLTRSYLSKVERGLSNPSIGAAMTIAKALGIPVERLFGKSTAREAVTITRANGGKVGEPASFLSLVAGTNPERIMRAFIVRPGRKPGRGRIMSHHEGEEILFVLSGRIEMQLGRRKEILNVGDCVQFDSTIPHRLIALSAEKASALVIVAAAGGHTDVS